MFRTGLVQSKVRIISVNSFLINLCFIHHILLVVLYRVGPVKGSDHQCELLNVERVGVVVHVSDRHDLFLAISQASV